MVHCNSIILNKGGCHLMMSLMHHQFRHRKGDRDVLSPFARHTQRHLFHQETSVSQDCSPSSCCSCLVRRPALSFTSCWRAGLYAHILPSIAQGCKHKLRWLAGHPPQQQHIQQQQLRVQLLWVMSVSIWVAQQFCLRNPVHSSAASTHQHGSTSRSS